MFIATQPGALPVCRSTGCRTGALNLLVFALLTYIADLRGPDSVIFAMEEPEIALPPHTQRRMVDFVTTTHGPGHRHLALAVRHREVRPGADRRPQPRRQPERFPARAVVLGDDFKPKKYREQRRQFAEAVLAQRGPGRRGRHRGRCLPGGRRRSGRTTARPTTSTPTWPASDDLRRRRRLARSRCTGRSSPPWARPCSARTTRRRPRSPTIRRRSGLVRDPPGRSPTPASRTFSSPRSPGRPPHGSWPRSPPARTIPAKSATSPMARTDEQVLRPWRGRS